MPRPSRTKRVCRVPSCNHFQGVIDGNSDSNQIRMSLEEYETIRLIDYRAMTQEECAKQMNVSRTTAQALYRDARRKLARFLVEGSGLVIEGGDAVICGDSCGSMNTTCQQLRKEDKSMILAVTYEKETGDIFQHFGHTETFKLYYVEDGQIVDTKILDTNGTGHGALAGLLDGVAANILICGGIGGGARNALAEVGMEVYPGAMGNADENVKSFLAGSLNYDPNTMCSHHGEGHTCGDHEEGHACGGHEGGHCGGGCH